MDSVEMFNKSRFINSSKALVITIILFNMLAIISQIYLWSSCFYYGGMFALLSLAVYFAHEEFLEYDMIKFIEFLKNED